MPKITLSFPKMACPRCKGKLRAQITYRTETGQNVISVSCNCGFGVAFSSNRYADRKADDIIQLVNDGAAVAEAMQIEEEEK